MKKPVFLVILSVFGMLFLSGCSMMPDDEDIINGSVMESEIFDDEELRMNDEEGEEENIVEDEEMIQDDEELNGSDDIYFEIS